MCTLSDYRPDMPEIDQAIFPKASTLHGRGCACGLAGWVLPVAQGGWFCSPMLISWPFVSPITSPAYMVFIGPFSVFWRGVRWVSWSSGWPQTFTPTSWVLELQASASTPSFYVILSVECRALWMLGKNFINWAIPPSLSPIWLLVDKVGRGEA